MYLYLFIVWYSNLFLQNKQFCLTGKGALLLKKFEEIKANYSALLEKISKLTEERLVFRM